MSSYEVVIQDIPQVASLFIYLFLELKYSKCWNLLSHNYFHFAFDRKYLKIMAFSKQDGLKMNGSSIRLGKMTVAICSYCSKDVRVTNMEKAALISHMKDKKQI